MNPSSDKSNHWKSLASELGAEWTEPEPELASEPEPAPEEEQQPVRRQEAEAALPPRPAPPERTPFREEPSDDLFGDEDFPEAEEDALFSDTDLPEEVEAKGEEPESLSAEPVTLEAEPAPAPAAPAVDRDHWRSLLGDLGLELPPEPEPMPAPEPEETPPAAADLISRPERFRDSEPEIVEAELIDEAAEEESTPEAGEPAPVQVFGGGLFSEEEERQFPRYEPAAEVEAPPVEDETEAVELAAALEEDAEMVETEEASPRKRGRRRTRRWKRLPVTTEAAEEEDQLPPREGERDVVEAAEEMGVADDLFEDEELEAVEEAEAVKEGEEAAPGEEPRRRRRRRRRSRKGERAEAAPTGSEPAEAEELEESEFEEPLDRDEEELFAEDEREEEEDEEEQRPRRRRRATAAGPSEARSEDAGEARPLHRKIPTWEEAVSVVVDLNMEARARSPSGGRRRR